MVDIVKLIQQQPNLYVMISVPEKEINQAEQTLGLHFSADYRAYIAAFGAVSFAGHELTGICKSNRLNVVTITLSERNNVTVPADWYVLEQANIDSIVLWQSGDGTIYATAPNSKPEKIANSLSEYIISR